MPALLVHAADLSNTWTMVTVTVDTDFTPKLYLNGTLVRTGLTATRALRFQLAQVTAYVYGGYSGLIDNYSVYNTSLSPCEVGQVKQTDGELLYSVCLSVAERNCTHGN